MKNNRREDKKLAEKMEALRRENAEGLADLQERMKDEGFRARVEALLLEGLNSPASPMTDEDWKELKRRVYEVHAKKPTKGKRKAR